MACLFIVADQRAPCLHLWKAAYGTKARWLSTRQRMPSSTCGRPPPVSSHQPCLCSSSSAARPSPRCVLQLFARWTRQGHIWWCVENVCSATNVHWQPPNPFHRLVPMSFPLCRTRGGACHENSWTFRWKLACPSFPASQSSFQQRWCHSPCLPCQQILLAVHRYTAARQITHRHSCETLAAL